MKIFVGRADLDLVEHTRQMIVFHDDAMIPPAFPIHHPAIP